MSPVRQVAVALRRATSLAFVKLRLPLRLFSLEAFLCPDLPLFLIISQSGNPEHFPHNPDGPAAHNVLAEQRAARIAAARRDRPAPSPAEQVLAANSANLTVSWASLCQLRQFIHLTKCAFAKYERKFWFARCPCRPI